MINDLLSRSTAFDFLPLVHIFQKLCGGCLSDGIVEVRADVCSAVGTILFAQVREDRCSALFGCELDLGLGFFLGRRHVGQRLGDLI